MASLAYSLEAYRNNRIKRSKTPPIPNKGSNDILSPGPPLFETLEAIFSHCNDSENEYLDDDSVDDDDYEYNTDDDWKSDDNQDAVQMMIGNAMIGKASNKKQSPFKKLPKALFKKMDYSHFMIRQITVHGDVRGNLETDQRERALIKKEIIETEKSYLKGLDVLLNEFIKPIFKEKMIPLIYERDVTSVIPTLINFHVEFLNDLQTQYDNDGDICSVFIKYADFMKIYIQYILSYQKIVGIFANNTSKELKKYLKQKRMQKQPLTNHLILPIKRIPDYSVLLSALKKKTPATHANYDNLCSALNIIDKVAISLDESKHEIENMSILLQVTQNMRDLNRNIVEPHRKFLDQFLFQKKTSGRPRQFFVFSDLIIVSNLKLKVKTILDMRTIDLKMANDPHIFSLFSAKGKPIQYQTETADDIITLRQLITKSRMAVWDSILSRVGTDGKSEQRDALKRSGVSHGVQYRNQLEVLQRRREKHDEMMVNDFKKSNLVKGKKKQDFGNAWAIDNGFS
eukprot:39820_1